MKSLREYGIEDESIPPQVDAVNLGNVIPEHEFPITPTEAWMILRGYRVKPRKHVDVDMLLVWPGPFLMDEGYIGIKS